MANLKRIILRQGKSLDKMLKEIQPFHEADEENKHFARLMSYFEKAKKELGKI